MENEKLEMEPKLTSEEELKESREEIKEEDGQEEDLEEALTTQENPDAISFVTQLRRADFQMLRHFYLYKKTPKLQYTLYMLFGCSFVMILIHVLTPVKWPVAIWDVFLVVAFVTGFALTVADSHARKLTKPEKALMGIWQRATFDRDDYLVIEWSDSPEPLLYDWDEFYTWYDTETHFFLFLSRDTALVIPKRESTPDMLARGSARLEKRLGVQGVAKKKNSSNWHTM